MMFPRFTTRQRLPRVDFFGEPVVTVMKYSSRNPTNNHAARFVRLGRISDQVPTLRKEKVFRLELLSLLFYLPAMTPDHFYARL